MLIYSRQLRERGAHFCGKQTVQQIDQVAVLPGGKIGQQARVQFRFIERGLEIQNGGIAGKVIFPQKSGAIQYGRPADPKVCEVQFSEVGIDGFPGSVSSFGVSPE